ncbi:hypothetical protein GCM10023311_16680 [Flaviramulus aquimarinus]|uniref:Lipocalin-like domain-containing protein n=1 Tax=Flaviramulus aquimarinus TaxID=1170456 RepID=A0ABP9F3G1_9FLAO
MKSNNLLKLLGIFIIGLIIMTSCSSDDDSNTDTNFVNVFFFDKWWYDSNDLTADIYFHSDGDYEQRTAFQGNEIKGTGAWTWEDENSGIMKIDNFGGSGQVLSSIWYKLTNIQTNTITIQQSLDGTDFSNEVIYNDSNN